MCGAFLFCKNSIKRPPLLSSDCDGGQGWDSPPLLVLSSQCSLFSLGNNIVICRPFLNHLSISCCSSESFVFSNCFYFFFLHLSVPFFFFFLFLSGVSAFDLHLMNTAVQDFPVPSSALTARHDSASHLQMFSSSWLYSGSVGVFHRLIQQLLPPRAADYPQSSARTQNPTTLFAAVTSGASALGVIGL